MAIERAYETCKRGDPSSCINTNLIRAFAKHQGRKIRSPRTYKGKFHWSEEIEGEWYMFAAPLGENYVKVIDAFDHEGKNFRVPVEPPMGPVKCVGISRPRRDTREEREDRRSRVNARVEAGDLVTRAKYREPQTPYVLKQNGKK